MTSVENCLLVWCPGTPQSVSTSPGKKQQELTAVQNKLGKTGKQSDDKLVAGMKRSLEPDDSDSEDDNEDDEYDSDEEEDDVNETLPMKIQQSVTKGLCLDFPFYRQFPVPSHRLLT